MPSIPAVPHGQVTYAFNMLAFKEVGFIRHEDTKAQQLKKIREYPSVQEKLPSPMKEDKYRALASTGSIEHHRKDMQALRAWINKTFASFEKLERETPKTTAEQTADRSDGSTAPPDGRLPIFSVLRKIVRGIVKGVSRAFSVGLLSRPGNKPDMKGAMQNPFRKGVPKGTGKSIDNARLLGKENIRERAGTLIHAHAEYLKARAQGHSVYGPKVRIAELGKRHVTLNQKLDGLRKATDEAEKAREALKAKETELAKLDDECRTNKFRLKAESKDLAAEIQKLAISEIKEADSLDKKIEDLKETVYGKKLMKFVEDFSRESDSVGPSDLDRDIARLQQGLKVLNRQQEIRNELTNDPRATKLENTRNEKDELAKAFKEAISKLEKKLEECRFDEMDNTHVDGLGDKKDGERAKDFRTRVNEQIERIRSKAEDHDAIGTTPPDPAAKTLKDAREIQDLLKRIIGEVVSEQESKEIEDDLKLANKNLERADDLVNKAKDYVEARKQEKLRNADEALKSELESLNGFAKVTEGKPESEEAEVQNQELRECFRNLYSRITQHPAPKPAQLDHHTVFSITYKTIVEVLREPGKDADPKLAIAVLKELEGQSDIKKIVGDREKGPTLSGDEQLLIQVIQTIALLPRGMEVLDRIMPKKKDKQKAEADYPDIMKLDAEKKAVALNIYLRADKLSRELGRDSEDAKPLLDLAKAAAWKLHSIPPDEVIVTSANNKKRCLNDRERANRLNRSQRVAYSAMHNRLLGTATDPESGLQHVSDALKKFMERCHRAVDGSNGASSQDPQGAGNVLSTIKNIIPTKGKTALNLNAIAAIERTSTAYGIAPKETGKRMDSRIRDVSKALQSAATELLREAVRFNRDGLFAADNATGESMRELLIAIAAAHVAEDEIKEAARSNQELRPEQCIVGGKVTKEDILRAVDESVKNAFDAAPEVKRDDLIRSVSDAMKDAIKKAMDDNVNDTNKFIDDAMAEAHGKIYLSDLPIKSKDALARNLNFNNAVNLACEKNAQPDLDEVNKKLSKLVEDTGLFYRNADTFEKLSSMVKYPLPRIAARPLVAEHMIQLRDGLKALNAQIDPDYCNVKLQALLAKAHTETTKLEHLIETSVPQRLDDIEDIYNYLLAKFEQLELRAKLRVNSGRVMGVSTKNLSDRIAHGRWLFGLASAAPKLKLEFLGGSNATLEISMTAIGFEIFIGKEKKRLKSAGVGLGGSIGISEAKGNLSAEKAVISDRSTQEGVKFVIPRSIKKEYSDNDMRDEAKKLLDAIFHPYEDNPSSGSSAKDEAAEAKGVPVNLKKILVECPHVSIAIIDKMSDNTSKQETTGTATLQARGKFLTGNAQSGGVNHGYGVKSSHLNGREVNVSEMTGFHNIARHNLAYGGQVSLNTGLGPAGTVASIGSGIKNAFGLSTSGATTSRQISIAGADVKLRIVTVDGKTHPGHTRRDREHTNAVSMRKSIEANREAWIQLGCEQLLKEKEYENRPLEEKRRIVNEDLEKAIAACEESERTKQGNLVLRNVFSESFKMTDLAATQLDGFRAREVLVDMRIKKLAQHIETLKKTGDAALADATKKLKEATRERVELIDAQNALFREDSSWTPWKLAAVERTQESVQTGGEILFRAGKSHTADAQRPIMRWPT